MIKPYVFSRKDAKSAKELKQPFNPEGDMQPGKMSKAFSLETLVIQLPKNGDYLCDLGVLGERKFPPVSPVHGVHRVHHPQAFKEMANMKTSFAVAGAVLMIGLNAMGGGPIKNVLTDIPYADDHLGKRQLVDEKHLLVMQVALKPGQQVPQHNANSNVHLLVVEGQIMVTLEGKDTVATKGDILPIAFKTLMGIRNVSKENASFLILKSPNPNEMKP